MLWNEIAGTLLHVTKGQKMAANIWITPVWFPIMLSNSVSTFQVCAANCTEWWQKLRFPTEWKVWLFCGRSMGTANPGKTVLIECNGTQVCGHFHGRNHLAFLNATSGAGLKCTAFRIDRSDRFVPIAWIVPTLLIFAVRGKGVKSTSEIVHHQSHQVFWITL